MDKDKKTKVDGEILPGAIIDPCEIECEDACESSCQTTCEKSCQTTCQKSCQTACQLGCQTGCQVSCETGCEVSCQNCLGACQIGCEVDCMSNCELACQSSCELFCQSTCEKNCQDTCQLSCQNCLGACESTCEKNCESTCEKNCQDFCELNCQSACETSCQTSCEKVCQYACESSCQTTCEKSCQTTCQRYCQLTCQISCQDECQIDCMTTCELSCQCTGEGCMTTCENSCQETCELSCQEPCMLACQEVCEVDCMETCELSCQCSGQGCMTTCEKSCQCTVEGCESCQCSAEGCMTQCEETCQCEIQGCESCQCSSEICDGCQTQCELNCMDECELNCMLPCETSCESICEGLCQCVDQGCEACMDTCELSCMDNCELSCQATCEINCETTCQAVCQTACQSSCQTLAQLQPATDDHKEYIHYGSEGINFGTGNLSFTNVDMSISSPGFELNTSRTYNSRNDRPTRAFGKGWSFGFEGNVDGDTTVAVALPNGSVQMFSKNGDGTYSALDSRSSLEKNTDNNFVLITKDQYRYQFNSDGYLVLMEDRNENAISIEVDTEGKVTGLTDQADRHYTVTYNTDILIEKIVEDITLREVRYEYTNSKLVKVIDPAGNEMKYGYDIEGYLNEIKDHNDNILKSVEYDHTTSTSQHRIVKLTDEYGNVKNYTYDIDNRKATITDSNGRTTAKWYDQYNYLIKVQDPEGLETITEYFLDDNENKYGEVKSVTDRNGNKTEHQRDSKGNITKKINPDQSFIEYSYDEKNNLISEKDEKGNYTFYIYDSDKKNLIKKAQPLNGTDVYTDGCDESVFAITEYVYHTDTETTQLGYKAKSLLKTTIDPEGNQTNYTYYPNGNIKTVEDPETNQVTTVEYNDIGWKTAKITAMGYRTEYTYDNNSLIEKTILKNGKDETKVVNYDVMGRKIKEIAPNLYKSVDDTVPYQYSGDYGYRYQYYAASGKLWKETDPENNTTTYTYDQYGNIKTKTLPNGAVYEYEYDVVKRITKIYFKEDEDSQRVLLEEYIYEILGDKTTRISYREYINDTDYAETIKTYDYAERVIQKQNPDGTQIAITYNSNGTINSTTDENGKATYFKYDGLNRVTEKWIPFEESQGITLYTYTKIEYYKNGNKKARRLGKEKVELFQHPTSYVSKDFLYYKNSKLKQEVDSAGRRIDYYYDYDGNLTKVEKYIDATNKQTVEYENNYFGLPDKKKVHVTSGNIHGNDFNSTETTLLITSYAYDKNGNKISVTTPDMVTTSLEYDKLDRITKTIKPGVDELGNAVNIQTTKEYNWEGKPLTVIDPNINTTSYQYNKRGLLEKITDANSGVTAYYYDLSGRKIAEVSPENYDSTKELSQLNRVEYTYDLMDRVIAKTDIFEEKQMDTVNYQWSTTNVNIITKAYKYDNKGNLVKELDALGIESGTGSTLQEKIDTGYGIEKKYNLAGKVTEILDPVGKDSALLFTAKIEYDSLGRKISETNAKDAMVIYEYDDGGNLIALKVKKDQATPEYTMEAYTYDLLGNILTKTDGNGNIITLEYNELNKIRKEIHPSDVTIPENIITYQYDEMGNLKNKENTLGRQELYTYDNQGRIISIVSQKNDGTETITISKKYDKNGNLRFQTDGNGNIVEKTYDSLNRVETTTISVKNINDVETIHKDIYQYDKNGNVISEKGWRNNIYSYIYDPINRLVEKINPDGISVERLEYYHNNVQWKSYDPLNNTTEYIYDKNSRLIKTLDPEGHETDQSYDEIGNLSEKKDGKDNTTSYGYDEQNRLVQVTNAKGEITSYEYDIVGNKTKQIDGKGNTTILEYNSGNKVTRRIDHGGRTQNGEDYIYDNAKMESYTYNSDGSLSTKTDRNSNTTTYTYDIHGRLLSQEVRGITISYTYDNNGNKLTVTDETGTTTRTYDELNRVKTKNSPDIGTTSFIYDIIDNIEIGYVAEKTTDPKGNETTKVYDKTGRLKEVTSQGNTTTYTYYDNGSRKSVTYPDGTKEELTYNKDNLLLTLTNKKADDTIIESFSYGYDEADNQTSKTDHKGTTTFTYDQLNRLKTITEPGGKTTTYTYDKAGNRETEQISLGGNTDSTTYSYNEQNRLLTTILSKSDGAIEKITNTYDNNGNITQEEKEITEAGASVPTITTTTYQYNQRNQLIQVTKDTDIIKSKYNGEGLRVEKEVNGQVTRYLYEGSKVILETDDLGNQKAQNVYGSNLLQRTMGTETVSYLYNGHGDVTALIDDAGTIQGTYYYDAFGNPEEETGDVDNPYRYAGYQYDKETGHYYLNARYYNPKVARFLTEDTYRGQMSDPLSLNLYTYGLNNPIAYIDPSGHKVVQAFEDQGDPYTPKKPNDNSKPSTGQNKDTTNKVDTSTTKPTYDTEEEEILENIKIHKKSDEYKQSLPTKSPTKKSSNDIPDIKTQPTPSPKEPVEEIEADSIIIEEKHEVVVRKRSTRDNVQPPEVTEIVIDKKPNNVPSKTDRTDRNVIDPETIEKDVKKSDNNESVTTFNPQVSPVGISEDELNMRADVYTDTLLRLILLENNEYFYKESVLSTQISSLKTQLNRHRVFSYIGFASSRDYLDVISELEKRYLDEVIIDPIDIIKYELNKEMEIDIKQIESMGIYRYLITDKSRRKLFIQRLDLEFEITSKINFDIYEESINNQILRSRVLTRIGEVKMLNDNYKESKESYDRIMNSIRKDIEKKYYEKVKTYYDQIYGKTAI